MIWFNVLSIYDNNSRDFVLLSSYSQLYDSNKWNVNNWRNCLKSWREHQHWVWTLSSSLNPQDTYTTCRDLINKHFSIQKNGLSSNLFLDLEDLFVSQFLIKISKWIIYWHNSLFIKRECQHRTWLDLLNIRWQSNTMGQTEWGKEKGLPCGHCPQKSHTHKPVKDQPPLSRKFPSQLGTEPIVLNNSDFSVFRSLIKLFYSKKHH